MKTEKLTTRKVLQQNRDWYDARKRSRDLPIEKIYTEPLSGGTKFFTESNHAKRFIELMERAVWVWNLPSFYCTCSDKLIHVQYNTGGTLRIQNKP